MVSRLFKARSATVVGLTVAVVSLLSSVPALAVNYPQSVIVNPSPVAGTPDVLDGAVMAFTQIGNTMFAGGSFTQVKDPGGPTLSRTGLFAFDATTGQISNTFNPTLDGEVMTLATDGTSLFVGGAFSTVNGVTEKRIVKLDPVTGQAVPGFNATVNSGASVTDMVYRNGELYVGGAFTTINGATRDRLAGLNPNTGALDPNLNLPFLGKHNGGQIRVAKLDVTPDGSKLIAIGNFTTVNGLDRNQIVMIDLTTTPASVANWETDLYKPACASRFDTYMRDVDISPDGSYFVVAVTGAWFGGPNAGVMCDTTSRWPMNATGTGLQPTWVDYTGGDTTWSIASTGAAIYVGGHMRWQNNPFAGDSAGPGAVPRKGIAALDPVNGLPFSWNPTRDRGEGVFAFFGTPQGLWVGSDTANIDLQYRNRLALEPVAGGETVPPENPVGLPNNLWSVPSNTNPQLPYQTFDGTNFGSVSTLSTPGINWSQARGAFLTNGQLYTGWADGNLYARSFDGTTLGPPRTINLYGLTSSYFPISSITGMFYTNGRLYYTVSGNTRLFYRYFTPESEIVGAQTFTASGVTDGLNWSTVRGMTLAGGKIYFAKTDSNLYSMNFANGAPVPGTQVLISGPSAHDGRVWGSQGLFMARQSTDTFPPTQPGTPTAVSNTPGVVNLTWGASSDSGSSSLTYRVFRNDGTGPVQVGSFSSSSTTTVQYTDSTGTPGATYTYTVDATDGSNNTSTPSNPSNAVTVLTPDVTPPSAPGTPTGVADGKTAIDLTWSAATDDRSTTLTYFVYRDGLPNPVGTVVSSQPTVQFTDTGLDPNSTHTYYVTAEDQALNIGPPSQTSAPITTLGDIFSDSFSSGDFSKWTTVTRMTIDNSTGGAAPPSALAQVTGQSAWAAVDLPQTYPAVCLSFAVNVTSNGGTSIDLARLRTAGNGPLMKIYETAAGKLVLQSEVSSESKSTGVALPSGWNTLELCGTVGSAGAWNLSLNGSQIVSGWTPNTGTSPVGRIQIGYNQAATFTANFDDVVLDQGP